jgi:catechol 2,3-dioxygenase-like lactoylglutathione lyase family enzyme
MDCSVSTDEGANPVTGDALFSGMFNVGVKAPDLDAEVAFMEVFSPTSVERVKRDADFGPKEIVSVVIASTRFFLFPSTVYDPQLEAMGASFPGGIGHISFMTDDMDRVLEVAAAHGIEPILGPYEVTPRGHGTRRVAFFRSPNGTILESQQLVESE